jgi:DNA/RNA endonuclease YhcR with UshA esterase domain
MGLATAVFAQSCQEIHGLGSNGCAPSPMEGTVVTVEGVCYVIAGTYNAGSVYWQCPDGEGGLLFFDSAATDIQEGDLIQVTGTVGAFGDEIQLNDAAWTIIENDHWGIPHPIATGTLAGGTDLFGDFMRIEGVLSVIDSGYLYEVDDGSGPVTVFIDNTTGIDIARMEQWLGDWVSVIGSTKCYEGAGEILPRRDLDIQLVSIPVERITWGALKALY